MKKFLKATLAIALVATMLVACLISISAENVAPSATYTITRLTGGPGSDDEGAPQYKGTTKNDGADLDLNRLNDGYIMYPGYDKQEALTKVVCLAGTARTHRISFDLGSEKEVSSVVLYLWDTYRREYQGSPAGNRGYELDNLTIYSDAAATKVISAKKNEEQISTEIDGVDTPIDLYKTTLSFSAIKTQYITIDISATQPGHYENYGPKDTGAYIVTINEIEIYTGSGENVATETQKPAGSTTAADTQDTAGDGATETQKPATTKSSGTVKAGDTSIALIVILSVVSLAGAAVVLKKKHF